VPDFPTDAVMDALARARNKTGIDYWQVEPAAAAGGPYLGEDFDMKGPADLFAVARRVRLPEPGLADRISAVLRDPETPTKLFNALADALSEITADALKEKIDVAEFIARGLFLYRGRQTAEGEQ
jgi:hypothetical protein